MSYHAIGHCKPTSDWWEDAVNKIKGVASELEASASVAVAKAGAKAECDPSELGEEFCVLYHKKGAEFAAAQAAGMTPAQWYKQQGITPAGKPLPVRGLGENKVVILGGAALVAFLLFRKK